MKVEREVLNSLVELSWALQWKGLLIFREIKQHFSCVKNQFSLGIVKLFFFSFFSFFNYQEKPDNFN